MSSRRRAPSYFQLVPWGAPGPHPSSHPHPNAPTLTCLLCRQMLPDGVATRRCRRSQGYPALASCSGPLSCGDPVWRSPELSEQKVRRYMAGVGRQRGYSEGSAPSVGHSGNCLCLAGLRSRGHHQQTSQRGVLGPEVACILPVKAP